MPRLPFAGEEERGAAAASSSLALLLLSRSPRWVWRNFKCCALSKVDFDPSIRNPADLVILAGATASQWPWMHAVHLDSARCALLVSEPEEQESVVVELTQPTAVRQDDELFRASVRLSIDAVAPLRSSVHKWLERDPKAKASGVLGGRLANLRLAPPADGAELHLAHDHAPLRRHRALLVAGMPAATRAEGGKCTCATHRRCARDPLHFSRHVLLIFFIFILFILILFILIP